MDFVSLVTASDYAIKQANRFLQATTEGGHDSDDNFAHVSATSAASAAAASASAAASSSPAATVASVGTGTTSGALASGERPLLSPSSEAELFLLATNFLLYVAMVIIITMIAKIYFPESLKRGRFRSAGPPPSSQSISYRRVEGDNGPADDDADEDDEENTGETAKLIELEDEDAEEKAAAKRRKKAEEEEASRKKSPSHSLSRERLSKEFDRNAPMMDETDEGSSRAVVMKRLMFCCIMLNVTFVTWGVLQERMLTRRYPRLTGEYFTYSYALVFTNRFWTLILSSLLLLHLRPTRSKGTVIYEYSFPSVSNMLSSWCQYEALRYVSFPAVTLFKCFKLAPVMAMGRILGNKAYPQYDYVVALVIGAGLAMFMSSSDNIQLGYNIYEVETSEKWTGILMLCLYLFFDSFTGQWQSRMFQRHRDLSMIELLFATSAFSTVLSFITLVHTHELGPALNFVYRHSEIHLHFFLFSICSTIGQLTIFYTIKNFGAVVFSIIMTTRVLLSIALSCILYDHPVTSTGFFGLMTVMGAVIYRVKRKAEGTQLIKWQGMGDEKAVELVQEWHEHLDM